MTDSNKDSSIHSEYYIDKYAQDFMRQFGRRKAVALEKFYEETVKELEAGRVPSSDRLLELLYAIDELGKPRPTDKQKLEASLVDYLDFRKEFLVINEDGVELGGPEGKFETALNAYLHELLARDPRDSLERKLKDSIDPNDRTTFTNAISRIKRYKNRR